MLPSDITLNAQPWTGIFIDKVASEVSRGPGYNSVRAVASLANTNPLVLSIGHQEVKKGSAKYLRSTMALTRSNIAVPTANPEGVTSYGVTARFILERPVLSGVVSNADICTQVGELFSVFGVSLSVSGVPTTNMMKFLARES